jgi:hypothetical protein
MTCTCGLVAGDELRDAASREAAALVTWDVRHTVNWNSVGSWLVGRKSRETWESTESRSADEGGEKCCALTASILKEIATVTWNRLLMVLCQKQTHSSIWQMTGDVCEIFLLPFLDMQMKQNGASWFYLIDFVAENQS